MAWEAQFGDFVNGAQIIIDQFLAAAERSGARRAGSPCFAARLRGQGSRALVGADRTVPRPGAEDNMQVADPTNAPSCSISFAARSCAPPGNRSSSSRPKRYLRGREAYSPARLREGHFREVLDDPLWRDDSRLDVRRVVIATGKVALDTLVAREKQARRDVAVVRVEQLYPWPETRSPRPSPATNGLRRSCGCRRSRRTWGPGLSSGIASTEMFGDDYRLSRIARMASGSPATGSHSMHDLEQEDLLARALG